VVNRFAIWLNDRPPTNFLSDASQLGCADRCAPVVCMDSYQLSWAPFRRQLVSFRSSPATKAVHKRSRRPREILGLRAVRDPF